MRGALKVIFLLPVCQVLNLAAYAGTRETWPAKIATFVAFLPVILFTTTIWVVLWIMAIYAAKSAVGL